MENENLDVNQKTLEGYFQEYNIEDADTKMKLIPELNQMVYDRNEAIRRLDDSSVEEYQKKQILQEIAELDEYIKKIFDKGL